MAKNPMSVGKSAVWRGLGFAQPVDFFRAAALERTLAQVIEAKMALITDRQIAHR
ncbi:hypothetical protein ACWA5Z_04075 [Testudinibacter sp. P80/BLE/0925]|uniref:hypothetical protein n=1 Tax=Testudinibacter sp. TW-1 TaxID=3417757 RepID=UPI003D36FBD4